MLQGSYNLGMAHVLETLGLACFFVGMFAYGLWTGRMSMKNGWSVSREENDWAFWAIGILYLLMAGAVIFIGFIDPWLHIIPR